MTTEIYADLLDQSEGLFEGAKPENFEPAPGTVMVLPHRAKDKTPGGLHIPHDAITPMKTGVVVATGRTFDGCMEYEKGDTVLYRDAGCGSEIEFGEDTYKLLQHGGTLDDEILGRFGNGLSS